MVEHPSFCRACQFQLFKRLEELRQWQELGWKWVLSTKHTGSLMVDSVDEEIKRDWGHYF